MIAVDTNILVYAHRTDAEWHEPASMAIRQLAEGTITWAIPWPCLHEFLAIVTHPRIYDPASEMAEATAQIEAWLAAPSLVLLGESINHWESLVGVMTAGRVRGPMVHDARIAAICMTNGVTRFLSSDRDFSRFPMLNTSNPLVQTGQT